MEKRDFHELHGKAELVHSMQASATMHWSCNQCNDLGLLALLEKPFEVGAEKMRMSSSYIDTGHAHIYSVKVERDNKDIFKFQGAGQNINTLAGVVKMIYKRQCTEDDDCLSFIKNKKTVMHLGDARPMPVMPNLNLTKEGRPPTDM